MPYSNSIRHSHGKQVVREGLAGRSPSSSISNVTAGYPTQERNPQRELVGVAAQVMCGKHPKDEGVTLVFKLGSIHAREGVTHDTSGRS